MLPAAKRTILCFVAIAFFLSMIAIILENRLLGDSLTVKNGDTSGATSGMPIPKHVKFYILELPEITSWLLGNYTETAIKYYNTCLNEEQAEIWLHRGFDQLLPEYRTMDAASADVIIVTGYLHLNHHLLQKQRSHARSSSNEVPFTKEQWIEMVRTRVIANKRHVVAIPTWNPTRGREIGIQSLVQTLQQESLLSRQSTTAVVATTVSSFGFERNHFWQRVEPKDIIPIPYVVKPVLPKSQWIERTVRSSEKRVPNSVFYVGNNRKHGVVFGGCNRTALLGPLMMIPEETDANYDHHHHRQAWYVRLDGPTIMSQDEYNVQMLLSDVCLIVCGDTPTSRSLSSAMLHGCIPLRIGSRWRGLCEPPCRKGWGWSITYNLSHLPYAHRIDWNRFPEVDEATFLQNPPAVLQHFVEGMDLSKKSKLRTIMQRHQMAWVYGWGDPVTSNEFGDAVLYAWESVVDHFFISKSNSVPR